MAQVVAFRPGNTDDMVAELVASQSVFVDITTAAVGTETKVEHNLGRVPNGYAIVKQAPGPIFGHGHTDLLTPWDEDFMYITFGLADLELTLAVF